MKKVYDKLIQIKKFGASNSTLIDYLITNNHNGYDISDDGTMCIAYFNAGSILIVPSNDIIQSLSCIEVPRS